MNRQVRLDSAGESLRLLHVHAHPDDESSKGAAVTARYVAEGVDVVVATCTGGERGSILNPAMDRPDIIANISAIRRREMEKAREILGVRQVWLGFVDSGMPEEGPVPEDSFAALDPQVAAEPLVKLLRDFRPHVVTTYDENGGYPHPDHIQCHNVTMAALDLAADPQAWPKHGSVWSPAKVYYQFTFHYDRMHALHEAMLARGLPSPYEERIREWHRDENADRVTTRVPCAEYFHVRDQALLAHATQIDPDGAWFAIPLDVQYDTWPTEDFELVRSRVGGSVEEDDLFAGVAVGVRDADSSDAAFHESDVS